VTARLAAIASLVAAGLALGVAPAAFAERLQQRPEEPRAAVPAQVATTQDGTADGAPAAPLPFGVGERLHYEVRFGTFKVGNADMDVVGIESIRGRDAYHTRFRVKGGTFFYKVNDVFESWMDTRTLASHRYISDQVEGGREREKRYEIFPDRRVYQETGKPEQPSVDLPLDDGSFLYFVRTVPLEVGKTYDFNRYFRPDRNPVRIRVLRKERVKVPAGTFDAIVIQPSIKTKGIFGEGGNAEVWLSDDDNRIIVQLKSQLSFGSLNLYLRSYTLASTGTAATR
jgi:hypothetical protein